MSQLCCQVAVCICPFAEQVSELIVFRLRPRCIVLAVKLQLFIIRLALHIHPVRLCSETVFLKPGEVQDALVILGPFPEYIDVDHPEPVLPHYMPFDRQSVPDQLVAGVAEHVLSVDRKHELVQGYPCISGQVRTASEPLRSDDDCVL